MVIIDDISSEAQFKVLQTKWDDLLRRSGQYSPFLTHDWFRCCFAGYADGRDIFILIVRDGSSMIGVVPLWRYQDTIREIPVRRIGFIVNPDTPFVDFIIQEGRQEEVLKALLHYLYAERKDIWDVLTLGQWPAELPNHRILQETLREQGKNFFMSVASKTPYIPIQGEWEEFFQSRSVRFRKTRRNIFNRISKLNRVEIQCFRQDTAGTVFKDILAVSERSWKQKEGIAISSREEARRFFAALTELASQRSWLLVWLLKVDGAPIAMEYDLACGGKVYALRADFDEAYREYSPGAYLEYQIVKHLFEEKYLEYNTGPGMNAYKLHWTEQLRENVALHICNNNLKGQMIWGLENRLLPFLRRIRDLKTQIGSNRHQKLGQL